MNPNKKRTEQLNAQRMRLIQNILAQVSLVNRGDLAAHVEEYVNRCKLTSVVQFVVAVLRADQCLQPMSFRNLNVEAARKLVKGFKTQFAESSVRPRVILARQHLRWLFGVKRLDEQGSTCPDGKAIERALNVQRHKMKVVGIVLIREQQNRLVACIPKRSSLNPTFPMEVRDAWILRGLKGTGDRVSEFLSMRLRDVRFEQHEQDGGHVLVARLEMDTAAVDLKTQERPMYIREGVAELVAWLKVHPGVQAKPDLNWSSFKGARDCANPDAPLTIRGDYDMSVPLGTEAVRKLVKAAVSWAGYGKELAALSPHDFRHTAATEDARAGWNEPMLRQKYGWDDDSKMPSHYVHLNLDDQRARILADAQRLAKAASSPPAKTQDAVSALLELVRQAAGQLGQAAAPA